MIGYSLGGEEKFPDLYSLQSYGNQEPETYDPVLIPIYIF